MRRSLRVIALIAPLLLARPAVPAPIVLDPLTDPYPPNPCLTHSMQPVLFNGAFCDGTACPPDANVSGCPGSGYVAQVGLPGVPAGVTRTTLVLSALDHDASARIDPVAAQLHVTLSDGPGTDGLWWTYMIEDADWNLDLLGAGASAILIPISGAISPAHPLVLHIVMQDVATNGGFDSNAVIDWPVTASGVAIVPFSSFQLNYGTVFDSVDYVSLSLSECGSGSCGTVPARQFAVGPITFGDAGATPTAPMSWGRLKARYR